MLIRGFIKQDHLQWGSMDIIIVSKMRISYSKIHTTLGFYGKK